MDVVNDMKTIRSISKTLVIVLTTVCLGGLVLSSAKTCKETCCTRYHGNNSNNIAKINTTEIHKNISSCIEKCLVNEESDARNSSDFDGICPDDVNKKEISANQNATKNGCKEMFSETLMTNNFVATPDGIDINFYREHTGNTKYYYVNITWQPLNISDSSKKWSHYAIFWLTGDPPHHCDLVPKDQTFFLINSSLWKYSDAIQFNVFTYPLKYNYDKYELNSYGKPRIPAFMVTATFPPEPEVTASLMAAIIVGSCVGVAFFVAVAVAWKLNIRDIWSIPDTTSKLTILEEDNQVYLSYFHEDDDFMAKIVLPLVNKLREEEFDVKMNNIYTTEQLEEGPNTWAQHNIANSSKVVVLCSPSYIQICLHSVDMNGRCSEKSRVWFEVQIISQIYSNHKSASKIVCLWTNKGRVPDGLPPWMGITYMLPQDLDKIIKRLKSRTRKRSSFARESKTSTSESKRINSWSSTTGDDDVFDDRQPDEQTA